MDIAYPTIPALGDLPYQLNEAHNRLINAMGAAAGQDMLDAVKEIYNNEVSRLTGLLQVADAMVSRINSGSASPNDTVQNVTNVIGLLNAGIDGLNTIVGNSTALEYAQNVAADVETKVQQGYDIAKVGADGLASIVTDKIDSYGPWIILILFLVLGIAFYTRV